MPIAERDENSSQRHNADEVVLPPADQAKSRGDAPAGHVLKCNFRSAGQLSNEQKRNITSLHEAFARDTAKALGMYLRTTCEMELDSTEQLTFSEYIGASKEIGYVATLHVGRMGTTALLHVDPGFVSAAIDLLLGGSGALTETRRELTEIDVSIMDAVSSVIARQLEHAWRALQVTVTIQRCVTSEQLQRLYPATEKIVLLSFQACAAGARAKIQVLAPSSLIGLLLRHTSEPQTQKRQTQHFERPSLRERLLDCEFSASLCLPPLRVQVRDVLALARGSVLKLRLQVKSQSVLMLEGREIFEAVPARNGNQRAAQLSDRIARPGRKDMFCL